MGYKKIKPQKKPNTDLMRMGGEKKREGAYS